MGHMHGEVYGVLPDVNLVAVCGLDPTKNEEVAQAHGARTTTSIDDILNDASIDVVDICLPTFMHADVSIRALEAGKHVFCEKPMALTVEEADNMMAAAEKAGKYLMIGHCIRFWPEYTILTSLVETGKLGRLTSLNMTRYGQFPTWSWENWLSKEDLAGGGALDMHIHDTDYANFILGTPPSMEAWGTIDEKGTSHIYTTMAYPGTVVSIQGGWNLPKGAPFKMAFRAIFENGLAIMDGGPLTIYYADGTQEVPEVPVMKASGGGNISDLGGYFYELRYFYDQLSAGNPVDMCTPESSRESLRITLEEIAAAKAKDGVPA